MARPPRQTGRKVSFTPETAQRIVSATLKVEAGSRDMAAPARRTSSGGDELVLGTFTLPWPKGSTKAVTDSALSAVTYQAKNHFTDLTGTGTKACCIAYASGGWILIAAEC